MVQRPPVWIVGELEEDEWTLVSRKNQFNYYCSLINSFGRVRISNNPPPASINRLRTSINHAPQQPSNASSNCMKSRPRAWLAFLTSPSQALHNTSGVWLIPRTFRNHKKYRKLEPGDELRGREARVAFFEKWGRPGASCVSSSSYQAHTTRKKKKSRVRRVLF